MALHDFACSLCGAVARDVVVPTGQRATDHRPRCHQHHYPLGGLPMEWVPQARFSLFSDSGKDSGDSFAKFTLPVEDPGSPTGFREETVGSLADIRRLERESEQLERDGLGRRMVWRDYSQDASNRDKHTLGEDPSVKVPKFYSNGTPVKIRRGDPVIADHGEVHQAPLSGDTPLAALER